MIKTKSVEISTWILLFNDWVDCNIRDRLDESVEKGQEKQFCTFWGINQDIYYGMINIGENPLDDNGLWFLYKNCGMKISSDLPKWVIQELYTKI